MIELEVLNWSFQLLFYIYDMISGMSRVPIGDGNSGFFCVPGGIFIVLTSGKHLAKFVE